MKSNNITKNIVPFIDVLFTFLMVFVCITMLLKAKSDTESAAYQQENALYLIVLNWEGKSDLDLWGKDPQGHIVSFNRREGGEGSLFSLNRDNQGSYSTEVGEDGEPVSKINEELISIRGAVAGEYIFTVHSYNIKGSSTPIKATVKLIKNKPYKVVTVKDKEFNTSGEVAVGAPIREEYKMPVSKTPLTAGSWPLLFNCTRSFAENPTA